MALVRDSPPPATVEHPLPTVLKRRDLLRGDGGPAVGLTPTHVGVFADAVAVAAAAVAAAAAVELVVVAAAVAVATPTALLYLVPSPQGHGDDFNDFSGWPHTTRRLPRRTTVRSLAACRNATAATDADDLRDDLHQRDHIQDV